MTERAPPTQLPHKLSPQRVLANGAWGILLRMDQPDLLRMDQPDVEPMLAWEYRLEQWAPDSRAGAQRSTGIQGFEALFDQLGSEGWEYVGTVQVPVLPDRSVDRLVFKRPRGRPSPVAVPDIPLSTGLGG